MTINELKIMFIRQELNGWNMDPRDYVVLHDNNKLDNQKTLSDYNIQAGKTLEIIHESWEIDHEDDVCNGHVYE